MNHTYDAGWIDGMSGRFGYSVDIEKLSKNWRLAYLEGYETGRQERMADSRQYNK